MNVVIDLAPSDNSRTALLFLEGGRRVRLLIYVLTGRTVVGSLRSCLADREYSMLGLRTGSFAVAGT